MKLFLLLLLSLRAEAYVENVTHGYVNCMACHHAPSGGGLLTDYGRSLSKELMSTWGWKGSERPLFGAINNTETVNWGGHIRTLQTYSKNKQSNRGKLFLMQQNVEVGVKVGEVWMIGTLGTQEGPEGTPGKERFLSERHFVQWAPSEDTRLRAGKFRQQYGLNDPNHTRFTKAPLGFGPNSETYVMEFTKFYDNKEVSVSTSLGRIDVPREQRSEKSTSATYSQYVGKKSKIGASALLGESPTQRRDLVGAHGLATLSEAFFTKFEVNHQRSHQVSDPQQALHLLSGFVSLGIQPLKGVTAYIFHEHLQTDLSQSETRQYAPGFGVQWLPIPHLELQAEIKKQYSERDPSNPTDSGWLLFHFYI